MKAIAVTAFGGPEVLELSERSTPRAALGEVLVAVEAAGVGLADVLLRQGMLPHLKPGFTPGLEIAGTVAAIGEGADEAWLGSRVYATIREGSESGGYAEFVAVSVDELVPVPPTVSLAHAVSLGINALVAEFVIRRAQLEAGEHVLVRGAGGGIGVMAVQIARRHGAVVTASTSSLKRAERLLELGASHVVNRAGVRYDGQDTGHYDVIIDPVAGPEVLTFTDKLKNNGRLVFAGIAGGLPPAEFANALLNQRSLTFSLLSLDTVNRSERQAALREIFAATARGELAAIVHDTIPLARANEAHATLEAGGSFGKIVLETAAR